MNPLSSDLKENREITIERRIREFIQENFITEESDYLLADDSLLEKGVIDSTGVLELVEFIEREFNIHILDEELIPENLDTIGSMIGFIQAKMAFESGGEEKTERVAS